MATLSLHLLGSPRVEIDGSPLRIQRRKSLALLAYLAITGVEQRRDALATLLWPESNQEKARGSLRRELSSLNHTLGGNWLYLDRETAALNPVADIQVDVHTFEELLVRTRSGDESATVDNLSRAAALYEADFLAGFGLAGCVEFDDWQFFQAESYRLQLIRALDELAGLLEGTGEYELAIEHNRRRLMLDPLNEAAHRSLIQLYAYTGRQAAALRQYDECIRVLRDELDVAPDDATCALIADVRARRVHAPQATYEAAPDPLDIGSTAATGELRTVTVLVVALAQKDEQIWEQAPDYLGEVAERLSRTVCPLLENHGATVNHLLDGGIVAVFGASYVHEDDPEHALSVALELVEVGRTRDLPLALGACTGLAHIKNIASDDFSVQGTVLRHAVRLQANAATGETLADEVTYRATRNAFRFENRDLPWPGRDESPKCYALLRLRRGPAKGRGIEGIQADLVGRDAELASLQAAVSDLLTGKGGLVTLVGDAGVGKSRLAAEVRQRSESGPGGARWLEGRCLEMTSATAYAPFADMLHRYLVDEPGEIDGVLRTQIGALTDLLRSLSADELWDSRRLEWTNLLLANLLSLPIDDRGHGRLAAIGPEQIRAHTLQALKDLFDALARRRPTALILEDLQWADEVSIDLIGLLMESLDRAPLLLICIYRPEPHARCAQLPSLATVRCPAQLLEVHLRELTPVDSAQMLRSLLAGSETSQESCDEILERGQGNPFFLEELAHDLIEGAELPGVVRQPQSPGGASVTDVPEMVHNLVLGRLDRLDSPVRQTAQVASVMGRYFTSAAVARMVPAEFDLDGALADLEDFAFVYRDRVVPEPVYAFRHVLVRDAVYATLTQARKRSLHELLAQSMETIYAANLPQHIEELAYHFERSEQVERAVRYLLLAGKRARRAYLNAAAADYYQRAMNRLQALPEEQKYREQRLVALTGLGQLYSCMSRFAQADESLRAAIALSKQLAMPARQTVRLYMWLGDLILNYGRELQECLTLAHEGLDLLGDDRESAEAAMMLALMGFCHDILGDFDAMIDCAAQIVRFVGRLPYTEELRIAYDLSFYYFYRKGDRAGMADMLTTGLRIAEEYHDLRFAGECSFMMAGQLFFLGAALPEVLAKTRAARESFERVGDRKRMQWANFGMAYGHMAWGKLDEAQRLLMAELDAARELNPEDVGDLLRILAVNHLAQGACHDALNLFEESYTHFSDGNPDAGEASTVLGHAYLACSQTQRAVPLFEDALRLELARENLRDSYMMRRTQFMPRFVIAEALTGLERALGDTDEFRSFCEAICAEQSQSRDLLPDQMYLERLDWSSEDAGRELDPALDCLSLDDWHWLDTDVDLVDLCADGLTIHAPNMRNLWRSDVSAPRLVRPVQGEFILQVRCHAPYTDRPAIGGILFWRDKDNFLRLEWGARGAGETSFQGSIRNLDTVIGRGLLLADNVTLRLARHGARLCAYCTADEQQWYSVGEVEFPASGADQIGLYAIGAIDRLFHPGPFPDGTAIGFSNVRFQKSGA